jgi:phosphoserine phosphatase
VTCRAKVIQLKDVSLLKLEQWLVPAQTHLQLPFHYLANQKQFTVHERYQCANIATGEMLLAKQENNSQLELIVFSELTTATFSALLEHCQLKLLTLEAINHRNNVVSYRFTVTHPNTKEAQRLLADFNQTHKIESAIIFDAPRLKQPGLLLMDMDSTTIQIECIDEIAMLAGVGEEVAAVTELAMQGQLDFSQSLYQRVGKLAGAPESILANVAKTLPLMPGLKTLVTELKQHQWRVAIASGGFTYFAEHLKSMLSLDAAFANILEISDAHLTGNIVGDVIDAQAKADCLQTLQAKFSIAKGQTVAMGDGANDLVMMAAAHLGVAYHAKPVVLSQADSCITQPDSGLDCLLHWLK